MQPSNCQGQQFQAITLSDNVPQFFESVPDKAAKVRGWYEYEVASGHPKWCRDDEQDAGQMGWSPRWVRSGSGVVTSYVCRLCILCYVVATVLE